MPKIKNGFPVPRLHTNSGRARVRLDGRTFWLGAYNSPEAQREYDRLHVLWLQNGRKLPPDCSSPNAHKGESVREVSENKETVREDPDSVTVTVETLVSQFLEWSEKYYRHPDGTPTREHDNFVSATELLKTMFGGVPIASFGPVKLIALREKWVKKGLARTTINAGIRRIRQTFRWAVARELCPVAILTALEAVEAIAVGRGGRETTGSRGSVSEATVTATLPYLPPMIGAMVQILLYSGCRVGEIIQLTTGQIDRSQPEVWCASLSRHKNSCRGKEKKIYFGPKSIAALSPWLLADPDAVIFSPRRVDDRQERRTGGRLPGKYYSRCGLSQCLKRAIKRGKLPSWTLAQLRHSAAVKITDVCGIEAAKEVLGHSTVSMTRHYAADSDLAARTAAKKIG